MHHLVIDTSATWRGADELPPRRQRPLGVVPAPLDEGELPLYLLTQAGTDAAGGWFLTLEAAMTAAAWLPEGSGWSYVEADRLWRSTPDGDLPAAEIRLVSLI